MALDPSLTTPIAPDPSDPHNWREIDRLRRLAEAEGRPFDPEDPYNWKGIAAEQAAAAAAPAPEAVTAPASTPGTDTEVAARNRTLFSQQALMLQDAGLGELFTLAPDGTPGGWLWEQITSGIDDEASIIIALEATDQFKARYPVIAQLRQQNREGGVAYVPTPADVRNYEVTVSQTLRRAGLPSWFYEDRKYIQNLMGMDLSADEIGERLGTAWEMVRNTDPKVLAAYSQFYGVEGENALVATFLDPTRTAASLTKQARTAYTAGMGRTIGIDLDKVAAERIADLPKTEAGIWQDLTEVSLLEGSGVFTEGITETDDFTAEDEGIESVVFGDGQARADLQRRVIARQANARSSTGGAALTQAGLTGVGTS
jgi:hypothetical protein